MEIAKRNGMLPPFTWIIVFQIPGSKSNLALALYFVPSSTVLSKLFQPNVDEKELKKIVETESLPPRYAALIRQFFFGGDDDARNEKFKMIPYIRDGPYLVKKTVPSKPALIGRRLPIRYFRGDSYMELDIDIAGGTKTAKNLTQMSVGFSSALVFDVAFLLEGKVEDELPEEIIGMASLKNVDLVRRAQPLAL